MVLIYTSKTYRFSSKPVFPATWWGSQVMPNPDFFLMSDIVNVIYKSQSHYLTQTYYCEKNFWAKSCLYLVLCIPNNLPYLVDGIQYLNLGNNLTMQFNYSSMLTETRLHVYTEVSGSDFLCQSTSCLFGSGVWLERELSEFTGLTFSGLVDSRRLLLDYFQEKQLWATHINNERSFNNTIYEVSVNF